MTQDTSLPYQPPLATWQPPAAPTQVTSPWVPPPPFVDAIPDGIAARAIVTSVAAGVLAQLLFVGQQGGINVLIWAAAVLGAAWAIRRPGARLDRHDLWLPPAALALASFIMLRDDQGLFAFNFLATASLTVASAVAIGGHPVSRRASSQVVALGAAAIAVFFGGAVRIAHGFRPLVAALPSSGHETSARVVRGLLIATPLVLGFVLLFAAADALFQSMFQRLLDVRVNAAEIIGRAIFAFAAAWFFAGTMAAVWLSRSRFPAVSAAGEADRRTSARLGTVEALVVLVAVDAIFALFVAIQAAYLFPGSESLAVSGLTYAESARRGFFELVVAAVLSALVILGLDTFIERRTWAYRTASLALATLTGLVLVSAAVRLTLYQQAYGWTELRFYVLAAIILLASGVVATIVLLVRGRVSLLPKFMLGAGLTVALVCNVVGPQSFVTAQNLQRVIDPSLVPAGGHAGLDAEYLGFLGADSVLVVLEALPRLPLRDAELLKRTLAYQADEMRLTASEKGWPSWNLARQRALDSLTSIGY